MSRECVGNCLCIYMEFEIFLIKRRRPAIEYTTCLSSVSKEKKRKKEIKKEGDIEEWDR